MISKEAIKRGYNRGNYVVGAPTQPHYAGSINEIGTKADLAQNTVSVDAALVEKLQGIADEVLTTRDDLVVNTRDWWARTMVAETGGKPATVDGVFVRVSTVEQVQAVMRLAHEAKVPVTVSAGRSNVTGAALPLRVTSCSMSAISIVLSASMRTARSLKLKLVCSAIFSRK